MLMQTPSCYVIQIFTTNQAIKVLQCTGFTAYNINVVNEYKSDHMLIIIYPLSNLASLAYDQRFSTKKNNFKSPVIYLKMIFFAY